MTYIVTAEKKPSVIIARSGLAVSALTRSSDIAPASGTTTTIMLWRHQTNYPTNPSWR